MNLFQSQRSGTGVPPVRTETHGQDARATAKPFRVAWMALVCLMLFGAISNTFAQSPADQFSAANKLYEEQKFSEAAAAYQTLINSGNISTAALFNLGNAHFQNSEFGKAIAAYRQAQKISPRDPDIRANLNLARNKVQNTGATALSENVLNRLTLNEWATLASVPLTACFVLLAFGQFRRDWQKIVRGYAIILAVLALVLGVCTGVAASQQTQKLAVVLSDEAVVRHGPFANAESAFNLRSGAELTVLDERENWVQISAGGNRLGWIPKAQVTVIN